MHSNTDWTADTSEQQFAASLLSERGFTGHEQLDNVKLIHMNGRVQDPIIGRMISADPFVPEPFNGQSFNRYSYVINNPTSLVDPSGFDEDDPRFEEVFPDGDDVPNHDDDNNWICVITICRSPNLDIARELDIIEERRAMACAADSSLRFCSDNRGEPAGYIGDDTDVLLPNTGVDDTDVLLPGTSSERNPLQIAGILLTGSGTLLGAAEYSNATTNGRWTTFRRSGRRIAADLRNISKEFLPRAVSLANKFRLAGQGTFVGSIAVSGGSAAKDITNGDITGALTHAVDIPYAYVAAFSGLPGLILGTGYFASKPFYDDLGRDLADAALDGYIIPIY